ncbi:lysophospholipid acyltransferase family protein [Pontibacter vulgaris]|uniref:lysophospholipid acyltransferase family protein n=1 Tax=Pontibacter vulgaris TaxID=2905679 RepID=UPI001FA71F08|nr:lysophospholipid acyltransferase family protein [Pontibacter vulgaris]
MLYFVLKLIFRVGLWVFFRKFDVRNRSNLPQQGPLLIVANHPNTFMDPVVIASLFRQPVYFIAKSTVFSSPFKKWLLRRMNLIPINRREDATAEQTTINNDEAFEATYKALQEGKTLLIFPEGNSFNERRLRKIKTGAARMALGATHTTPAPDVKILPIGLNYSAPTRFRSNVFVNIGKLIEVKDFRQAYSQDATTLVYSLTDEIRLRLEKLIITTDTQEEDELAQQISTVYRQKLSPEISNATQKHELDFLMTKAIIKSLHYFNQTQPERINTIKVKLNEYMVQLKRLHLHDAILGKGNRQLLLQSIGAILYLLIGFPVYLYGLLNNYIPYIIPSKVADRLTEEAEFRAPIMLSVGIFSFPLFYTAQAMVFWHFTHSAVGLVLYLVSLPVTGYFTLQYWNTLHHTKGRLSYLQLFFKRQHLLNSLKQQREDILEELERAKQDYTYTSAQSKFST